MENKASKRRPLWLRVMVRLVRFVFLFYIVGFCFAMGCSNRMIFLPQPAGYVDGPDVIKLMTTGGQKISAVHKTVEGAKFTMLISHGNAEDIGTDSEMHELFGAHGYNVFAYDYRGYGTSEGKPTEKNVYEDVEAAYDYLVDEAKIGPEKIIVFGRSVGSGPATYLASRKPVAGLVLESPIVSAFRVLTVLPLLPFDKFNNLSRIDKVDCPVLVMHGRSDEVVGFWHGEKLFDKAKEPKLNLWVDGAGHNDFYWVTGQKYWKALGELTSVIEKGNIDSNKQSGD